MTDGPVIFGRQLIEMEPAAAYPGARRWLLEVGDLELYVFKDGETSWFDFEDVPHGVIFDDRSCVQNCSRAAEEFLTRLYAHLGTIVRKDEASRGFSPIAVLSEVPNCAHFDRRTRPGLRPLAGSFDVSEAPQ